MAETYAANYSASEIAKLCEYRERVRTWPIDLRGSSVLDLGAGAGVWELVFAEAGASNLTWQDHSWHFERLARLLHQQHSLAVNYRNADLLDLDCYPDGSFDFVFARDSLRYSQNEWRVLDQISRIAHEYVYIESAAWRWSWRGPQGLGWKTAAHLLSPGLALVTRTKLLPTHWQCQWFVEWRLGHNLFRPIWRGHGPNRQSWRLLFRKQSWSSGDERTSEKHSSSS
jgi:SAM-dependent methyltransferase